MRKILLGTTIVACLMAGSAAHANKADGVLRLAFSDPIEGIDQILDPKTETDFTDAAVFSRLLHYDPDTKSYKGELAESFKLIDPVTLEFKLKTGITFHDGSPFGADDVVYTVNYLADPRNKFRLKTRFSFLKNAEKVDDRTVLVHMNKPYGPALARFASSLPIYPAAAHGALKDKADWGRHPIGTGPYRAVSIDASKGIVLEAFKDYKVGTPPKIKKIEIKPIPDSQSQLAELMTGGIDAVAANSLDMVQVATSNPSLVATSTHDLNFLYVLLDAKGRSGVKPLQDIRVRQAIFMALDRDALRKAVVAAGKDAEQLNRICFGIQIGCPEGGKPPAFDPAAAKKLLADAGYANGFKVEITAFDAVRKAAEAIAGYLRAIGIEASVDSQTMAGYRQKQSGGKIQILVHSYSHGGLPDAGYALDFFYGAADLDYAGDAKLKELSVQANSATDLALRQAAMKSAYDRIESESYIMPISANPTVFIHTKDVELDMTDKAGMLNPFGASPATFRFAR